MQDLDKMKPIDGPLQEQEDVIDLVFVFDKHQRYEEADKLQELSMKFDDIEDIIDCQSEQMDQMMNSREQMVKTQEKIFADYDKNKNSRIHKETQSQFDEFKNHINTKIDRTVQDYQHLKEGFGYVKKAVVLDVKSMREVMRDVSELADQKIFSMPVTQKMVKRCADIVEKKMVNEENAKKSIIEMSRGFQIAKRKLTRMITGHTPMKNKTQQNVGIAAGVLCGAFDKLIESDKKMLGEFHEIIHDVDKMKHQSKRKLLDVMDEAMYKAEMKNTDVHFEGFVKKKEMKEER